jgi:hypothetical protein
VSFDLCFHSRSQTQLQTTELEEYFRRLNVFTPQQEQDHTNFHYNNEDTWVYCTFSVPRAGTGSINTESLEFRLNYNRPISFPCETFPVVESFCQQFDLLVEDVQEGTIEQVNVGRLVDSWRRHNVGAVQAMTAAGMKLRYFPESKTLEWWRYTRVRNHMEGALPQDMFVPTMVFLESPENQLFRMIVLPEAAGQLLPPSDYVWIQRSASGGATETGFIRYDELVDRIERYLDDYKAFGETVKYLSPANALSVVPIIRKLDLQPVDLSTYMGFPANGFHNVDLNQHSSAS